ncbi:MAG: hypothetical protein HQ508_01025 [Candidatus Marinimicrobia bacterium]|nr:hypothetical protein [Candidatus Neomarinimicrobiota bacterium]
MQKFVFSLLIVVSSVGSIHAQDRGIGFGLSTEGLTGKYWLDKSTAISIHWNFGSTIFTDYLFDKPELLKLTDVPTPVYYGVGALIGTHEGLNDNFKTTTEFDLGIRGVLGISYYLPSFPVDIFIESTPTLKLLGKGKFGFGGSFGIRYFF